MRKQPQRQRTVRHLKRTVLFGAARGIATTAGSAVVWGVLAWWRSR
ncbi:hypothetical protein ACIO3O_01655 [Streptomyces sp. NPDC087440]